MIKKSNAESSLLTRNSLRKFAIDQARISVWEYQIGQPEVFLDKLTLEHFDLDGDPAYYPFSVLVEKIHQEDRLRVIESVEKTMSGEKENYRQEFRILTRDGTPRWLRGVGRMMTPDESGDIQCLIGVSYNITDEKVHERALTHANDKVLLMAKELNHRVKNLFSIMSFLITQSGEGDVTAEEAVTKARDRVLALSRAHALSNGFDSELAFSLDELLRDILLPYPVVDGQVKVTGTPVRLSAEKLSSLGLIFHELATNSVKYGALSDPSRALTVKWYHVESDIHLIWTEIGLGEITIKPVEGFGSQAIKLSSQQLKANLSRVFSSDDGGKMVFTLIFPADA